MNKQEIEKEIESTKSFIEFRREDIKKHEGEFHKINAIITKEFKKINDLREKFWGLSPENGGRIVYT